MKRHFDHSSLCSALGGLINENQATLVSGGLPASKTPRSQRIMKVIEHSTCAARTPCFLSKCSSLYKAAACSTLAQKDSRCTRPHAKISADGEWGAVTAIYRRFWPIMTKMPKLSHWPDRSIPFDYARSEVIRFTMRRCGIGLVMAVGIFHLAIDQKVISFDAASKTWAGVKGGAR